MLSAAVHFVQMKINQWKSQDELEALQEKKLLELLSHARRNVPYYREKIREIKGLEDLRSIPVLYKKTVRDNIDFLISRQYPSHSLIKDHTSGSTGTPLVLYNTRAELAYGIAFECHQLTMAGATPFDCQARIAHYSSKPNILQRFGIFRSHYLPINAPPADLLVQLKRLACPVLCSYPSVVRQIAHLNNLEGNGLKIRKYFSAGESLSSDARNLISGSFGCDVYNRYGCVETSWLASECEKGKLHIHSDNAIVETVDAEGNPVKHGGTGRIVVTPLWRRAMPLIRYALGDRGSLGSKCACGRGTHVLQSLEGREDDYIVLPSGALCSARSINLMDDFTDLTAYQIIQERKDLIVLRYVSDARLSVAVKKQIKKRIMQGCLGEKITIEFEPVDSIKQGNTGKIRTVISKVKINENP